MTLTQIQKMRRQSGFTLVELLIVMLIVGILSIAMLPMYKKYMCKAKYTAEGLPILATIKTQVDLYAYEHSYAPGIADTVYGWIRDTSGGTTQFQPATYTLTTAVNGTYPTLTAFSVDFTDATKTAAELWHLRSLVKESELTGKLVQPNHVFYACINPGAPKNVDPASTMPGDYAYAIGVFGDGNGLPLNSGVATMEIHMSNPIVGDLEDSSSSEKAKGITLLGSWSNFEGSGIDSNLTGFDGQIRFGDSSNPGSDLCGIWSLQTMGLNNVTSGSSDLDNIQSAVNTLVNSQECGKWEFPQYK